MIEIREFRGIKKLARPMELGRFNIVIGRNDSGKSTLLEALYLFPDPDSPDALFGFARISVLKEIYSHRKFLIYGYWGNATLRYRTQSYEYTVVLAPNSIEKRVHELSTSSVRGLHSMDTKGDYQAALQQEGISPSNYSILIKNNDVFVKTFEKYIFNSWDAMVKSGLNTKIVEQLINPSVQENFTEILKYENDLRLRKVVGEKVLYIRLRDLGSGVYRSVIFCSVISLIEPTLVLWDDFETTLHYSLNFRILDWLSKKGQIVISTQSIDTILAAYEANIKDLRIIMLKRHKDDTIDHDIIYKDELEDLIESNIDPRKLADLVGTG